MAVLDHQAPLSAGTRSAVDCAPASYPARFDAGFATLGLLLIAGNYLDGWAHAHKLVGESFFTPWHGVAYGALVVIAAYLAADYVHGGRLRSGYGWSAVGIAITTVGGLADLVWHGLFGVEVSIQAALSPPHLVLSLGLVLLVLGPWRAARSLAGRHGSGAAPDPTWRIAWPALTSLLAAWSMFTLQAQFIHPFATTWVEPIALNPGALDGLASMVLGEALQLTRPGLGVAALVAQAVVLSYVLLLLLRRWWPPVGTLTYLLTINALLLATQRDLWLAIPCGLVAGLFGDAVLHGLPHYVGRPRTARLVTALVPLLLCAIWLVCLAGLGRLAGSYSLWAGAVLVAGAAGWLLGAVAEPAQGDATPENVK
jgi:hypothetical protein